MKTSFNHIDDRQIDCDQFWRTTELVVLRERLNEIAAHLVVSSAFKVHHHSSGKSHRPHRPFPLNPHV